MFFIFFLFILLILVGADIVTFFLFIKKRTKNKYLRILWFLPSILVVTGIFITVIFSFRGMFGSIFVLIYLAFTIPKAIFAIMYLFDLPFRKRFKSWKIYPFTVIACIINVYILWVFMYGSIVGKTNFQVKEIDFYSTELPRSFDGFRVILISDLHLGGWKNNKKAMFKLVEIINRQNPDIVAVTGDIVNRYANEMVEFIDIFAQIKTRYGVFSVLGNHDYGKYIKWEIKEQEQENFALMLQSQANMHFRLLNNENVFITIENESIVIIGVENAGMLRGRNQHNPYIIDRSDLPKAMLGTDSISFKLLLCHDPSFWKRKVLDTDINLTVSGHTHGAQLSFGKLSPASLFYSEYGGLYLIDNKGLYVNAGIGFVGIPLRYGVYPEITVINLRCK